jgi:uncharacterized protein (TIGR00297 family)
MENDFSILLILGSCVIFLALGMEWMSRRKIWPQWICRKILHTGAVGACAIAPVILAGTTALFWIVVLAELALLPLVATGYLFMDEKGRKSWGIALFPIAYLALLFFLKENKALISLSMGILAISDAAAAVFGTLFATRFFNLTGDRKSILGSTLFFVSCFLLILILSEWNGFNFLSQINMLELLFFCLILTLIEALGSNGSDNFWIPLASGCLFYNSTLYNTHDPLLLGSLVVFGLLFSLLAIRNKLLTLDGAVMASVLGIWVSYFAGIVYLIPLFFFLVSSSFIGKLYSKSRRESDEKQGRPRDWIQVLFNGGIFMFISTFSNYSLNADCHYLSILMMGISIAVSTSDTWASEIGMGMKGKAIDLRTLKRIEPGISGGMSLIGTFGGLLGSAIIGFIFYQLGVDPISAILIMIVGFSGMVIDSLLGAFFQARYFDSERNTPTDRNRKGTMLMSGFSWITNDVVNLMSNSVCIILVFLYNMFG